MALLGKGLMLLRNILLANGGTGGDCLCARTGKVINVSKVIYVYTVITWQT